MPAIQKHSGWMMEWTSYIHNAIGVILFWKPLTEMMKAGVWNSVDMAFDRATAFWFLGFGVLMWMLGRLMRWLTREKGIALPRFLGVHLVVVAVVGAIFMPVSGFWIVIPQGIYILRNA